MTRDQLLPFVDVAIMLTALLVGLLLLAGCATREETKEDTAIERWDTVTINGTLTVPGPEGPIAAPIALSISRDGGETRTMQREAKKTIDGEAIAAQVTTAVMTALKIGAGGGGLGWPSIISAVGSTALVATTGYLALKKREQMKGS